LQLLKITKIPSSPNLPHGIFEGLENLLKSKKNHRFRGENGGFYGWVGRT
jgi:hypothetical protein